MGRDVGLNRYIWDLAYPGPRDGNTGQPTGNGPMALPGRYTVRMSIAGQTLTQPLLVRQDPRVARDVTAADLREQLAHNLRVRDLVSDANRAAARLRQARTRLADATGAAADTLQRLRAIEAKLLTPPIRYSTPGLQAHIQYLYSMRREMNDVMAQLNAVLGPDRGVTATAGHSM